MKLMRTHHYFSAFLRFVIIASFCCLYSSIVYADVYVYDAVAVQGEEVRLKAETRGTLFTQGGELVEFFVDDVSLGKNLSGGDGLAYRYYTASRTGLKTIRAVSRNTDATGFLLVLKRGAGLVAVDVEGALLLKGFLYPGRPESRQAVDSIAKRYPLIYLQTGETNLKAVRSWLKEYEYADAPMLSWDEGSLFDSLEKKGLKVRAFIGGPGAIESAARHTSQAFSFEPVKGAVRLKSWKEVEEKLK
ncbi:MAG TPA: hypothetical protein VMB77_01930 [Syntrophales bacterium]|nr:hypothetical protein [Syntrophales bacterium]